jgi:hypothetical protein
MAAHSLCLPVDLSTPGTYSGPYQRYSAGVLGGDFLRLTIAGSPSDAEAQAALAGLSAEITVKDDKGHTQARQMVGARDFHQYGGLGTGWVVDLPRCPAGYYEVAVRVMEPAKGLAGRPHCFVRENEFSDLEFLPALYANLFGTGCLALGMALLACNGILRAKPSSPAPRAAVAAPDGRGNGIATAGRGFP